jgi:NAD(P)-dependent dehydrogenase (short-subunit alcohol dehydrogenase family)
MMAFSGETKASIGLLSIRQGLDRRLEGKAAIVTGAAGGIGRCVAAFFAAAGASVMLADIRKDEARAVAADFAAEGARATAVEVDITDPESARRMVQGTIAAFGAVDVLVSCAGIDAPRGRAWELDDDHWRQIVDADLSGTWWCAKSVIPHMIERRSGRIIFIGSVASRRGNGESSAAYNAAKAGLNGLCFGLARQLEPLACWSIRLPPAPPARRASR